MGDITRDDVKKWESKRKVKKLVAALDAKDGYVGLRAAQALASVGDEPSLLVALDHQDSHICEVAANALASLPTGSSTTEILLRRVRERGFGSSSSQIVTRLGMVYRDQCIPFYVSLLSSSVFQVPEAAATVLDKWGSMGADTVTPLIGALGSANLDTRTWAAQLLGYRKDSRAVEPLMAALDDDDGNMRRITAKALAWIGDRRAIPALQAALDKKRANDFAERHIEDAISTLEKH
jgi:HEAT repeat protein